MKVSHTELSCTRHSSPHFTSMNSFTPSNNSVTWFYDHHSHWADRKMDLREIKQHAQCHTTNKGQTQEGGLLDLCP